MSDDDLPFLLYRKMSGEDLFRPRDASDADVHPESLRGEALALMDALAETQVTLNAAIDAQPRFRRWLARLTVALVWAWVRLLHAGREVR